jgi:uncharacterized protein (TIGR02118 family)
MIKRVSLIRRRPGMTFEEFRRYWLNEHATLSSRVSTLRKYVINVVDREHCPDAEWDGFSELWFDNIDALKQAYEGPFAEAIRADDANFIGAASVLFVEEHIVR